MQKEEISHKGIITSVDENGYRVTIISESACAACHAKGFCTMSDMKEKVIDIPKNGSVEHKSGDFVKVTMKQKMGILAVILGYLFPFILLITTLLIVAGFTMNEGLAGLAAIAILVPYYSGLYFFRNSLKKKFSFAIET